MQFSAASMQLIKEEAWRRENLIGLRATSTILGINVRTLRRWHDQGIGPKRQELVRKRPIFYLRAEVEEFAATFNRKLEAAQSPANGHSEKNQQPTSASGHLEIT
jgi:hypothetical protein